MPAPNAVPDAPVRVLAAASRALERVHCGGWYVFGALAVTIWSRPRMTADVDITVRLEDVESFCTAMENEGFALRVQNRHEFLARTRVIPFIHNPTGMPLDVVLAGPGIEDLFLSRAVTVQLQGLSVPVASPEDLIVMKILAGRPKDVEDVRSLLKDRLSTLDLAQIEDLLSLLEQALHQSDLIPVWTRELRAAGLTGSTPAERG